MRSRSSAGKEDSASVRPVDDGESEADQGISGDGGLGLGGREEAVGEGVRACDLALVGELLGQSRLGSEDGLTTGMVRRQ